MHKDNYYYSEISNNSKRGEAIRARQTPVHVTPVHVMPVHVTVIKQRSPELQTLTTQQIGARAMSEHYIVSKRHH